MSQISPISVINGFKPFEAAQLTKNSNVQGFSTLSSGKNSSLTKALELLSAALTLVEKIVELMLKREGSKTSSAGSKSGAQTTSQASGTSDELLWKPQAEKDGNLVVLTPSSYSASVSSVRVLSPSGERVLAVGTPSGTGNGGRAHFRFKRAGSSFPGGAILEIKMNDGTVKRIPIAEPGKRLARKGG